MKSIYRLKTTISVLLTVILVLSAVSVMPTANAAGTTYNVSTAQELADACAAINTSGSEATISLTADISGAVAINIENSSAVVTVVGNGHTLTSTESAIQVSNGAVVNLGDGNSALTLKSMDTIENPGIIYIQKDSVCNMYSNVTLKDHTGNNYLGGGVTVECGTFHMYGGTIDNCQIYGGSVCYGGGVAVYNDGKFIMDGGTISNCHAITDYSEEHSLYKDCYSGIGGGVFVTDGSTFIMNGGTITNNSATNFGGGIAMTLSDIETKTDPNTGEVIIDPDTGKGYVDIGNPRSKTTINGGTISGNSAKSGAGIFVSGIIYALADIFREEPLGAGVSNDPGLYINGGVNKDVEISSNTATEMGGGVLATGFKDTNKVQIYNARISDNTAANGAGVMNYKYWTKLEIDGCTISDNEASLNGGGIMASDNSDGGYTLINDSSITDNKSGARGAGVYYDVNSEIQISGADVIADNTFSGKQNNLNILKLKKPVKVVGDLTGSQIGLSDPTLWDDDMEDIDARAVSTKRLTDGFKTNNASLIPADAFTSDHEGWYVDFGEKFTSDNSTYKYTAKKYVNTLDLADGYEIQKRDNGELYIKIPANTFTGYTENVGYLYDELCYLYNNNNSYTYVKDYELYGYLSSYPGKIYYDNITKIYVAVFKMNTSSVYVLTSSDPDSFENFEYDNALFMASGNVQKFIEGEENTLALKIYYYYDETDISGLFDDNYTTVELEYDEPLDFEGAQSKTIYNINECAIATTKYVISKSSEDDGSYDYTGEVRLVRRTAPIKFHDNKNSVNEGSDELFRVYNAQQGDFDTEDGIYSLTNYKIPEFYNIPKFAGDKYVFAGWYYNSSDGTTDGNTAFEFDSAIPANVTDVYAHWIAVGEVNKAEGDDKELPDSMNGKYSGFELFGVQIRPEAQFDENKGEYWYGGLRFVTSISENLLSNIDALSDKTVNGNKVEYGFVTAAESTIDTVADTECMGIDKSTYKLQYKGENVNGVDTLLDNKTADERKTPNNFRYVTNVDCTSNQGGYGNNAKIKIDHKNFNDYRLATFVVTYNDHPENQSKKVVARAYLRYYDANGLLRTFYNDYGGTNVYGGCSTSYDAVKSYVDKSKTAVME